MSQISITDSSGMDEKASEWEAELSLIYLQFPYALKNWKHKSTNATCISLQLYFPPQLLQNKHLSDTTHFKTLLGYIFPG